MKSRAHLVLQIMILCRGGDTRHRLEFGALKVKVHGAGTMCDKRGREIIFAWENRGGCVKEIVPSEKKIGLVVTDRSTDSNF